MKKKRAGFAALLCTLLIVLDQITKALTVSLLKVHDIVVIPGVLTLTYVENRGAAFGIFQNKKIFFFLITAVMIAVFAYCYVRPLNQKSYRILRMLCVTYTAGALGNLIDRIFRGYVVDMIYFVPINFPVFNVADCYITVSTVILLIALFFCYQDDDFSFLKPSGKAGKKHE